MNLSDDQLQSLGWAILVLFLAVFVLILLKRFGNLKQGPLSIELNLFTYAYFCDIFIRILRHEPIWALYGGSETSRNLMIAGCTIGNICLLCLNWKLEQTYDEIDSSRIKVLTGVAMYALGILGLSVYFVAKVIFEK